MFEELDPDIANRLFEDKTDAEVADVIAHMRADDAADAIAELPQSRGSASPRPPAPRRRTKVVTLLGFNATSAGGIMGVDFLTVPEERHRSRRPCGASAWPRTCSPRRCSPCTPWTTADRLSGRSASSGCCKRTPRPRCSDIMDADPVRVTPDADVVDVTLLMADYNLMTVPVVDDDNQLLGVITVDDILEATIPDDWRRREPPAHPEPLHSARRADRRPAARARPSTCQTGASKPDQPTHPEPKG